MQWQNSLLFQHSGTQLTGESLGFTIEAGAGYYPEDIVMGEGKRISLLSGWDSTFTSCSGVAAITSMTIGEATLDLGKGCLAVGGIGPDIR